MSPAAAPTNFERARAGRHVPVLDGVRGLAILLVLVYHAVLYGGMRPELHVDRIVYRLASCGWMGVDLFFVLSGFLITGILLDAKNGPHYFRSFYARRVLRIFPLYFVFLLLFLQGLPRLYAFGPDFLLLAQDQAWYWSYLVNVRIAMEGWPQFGALGHFWSLAVEEQFYLVWPLVIFSLRRETLVKVCIACLVIPLLLRAGLALRDEATAAQVLTITRLDSLAMGGLLAARIRSIDQPDRWLKSAPRVLAACLLFLLAIFAWHQALWSEITVVYTVGFTIIALAGASLLALLLANAGEGPLVRVFGHRFMRFMGKYSYAIYVLHHPLIIFLGRSQFAVGEWPRLFGSQLPGQILVIAAGIVLPTALALVSWHLLEAPFLRLKERFPYARG